jgi:hypothetical protein
MTNVDATLTPQRTAVIVSGILRQLKPAATMVFAVLWMAELRKMINDGEVETMTEGELAVMVRDVGE